MGKALLIFVCLAGCLASAPGGTTERALLSGAITNEDTQAQIAIVAGLATVSDPQIESVLAAWRGGGVYLFETNGTVTPVVLDAQADSDGRAKVLRTEDGKPLLDGSGNPLLFASSDLAPAEVSSKLRRAIKTTLDVFALGNANPKIRRDAAIKLGQEQNADYLPYFEARLKSEAVADVRRGLVEAVAITRLAGDDPAARLAAVEYLGKTRSVNSISFLRDLVGPSRVAALKSEPGALLAVRRAILDIENYMRWGNLFGTAFRGLSLAAVLLVAALGLAITFGLMGIINMAHGEIMMVGAYTAYVTQNLFKGWFGASGAGFDTYFLAALPASFLIAALTGLALERGVIRFLYKRPLESLLATWGVSLVLQQVFREIFGSANVQVSSPSWLSGSFVIDDVLLAYNRLFVIGFSIFTVIGSWLLLTRTSYGLQVRAVMQNRAMASCLGVRTARVNMLTFAFGSGLAGAAGACLSQIGNVGPSLGQSYIVDCFMVVVLGGVGNLAGTVSASMGIGVVDQIMQPWLGAVLGKITVLGAIIIFLQWRPGGMFPQRGRGLES